MTGEILLKREKKPIISKISLADADAILYQLSQTLDLVAYSRSCWFPTVYYAVSTPQPILAKLQSKNYCVNMMPLFGVPTIEKLKEKVDKCKTNSNLFIDLTKIMRKNPEKRYFSFADKRDAIGKFDFSIMEISEIDKKIYQNFQTKYMNLYPHSQMSKDLAQDTDENNNKEHAIDETRMFIT